MPKHQTIEQKVGHTILQQPKTITVRDKSYTIAPPSTATLILASEAVSLLPSARLDNKNIVEEVLSIAKDCRPIGDILAILILGAKHLEETTIRVDVHEHSCLFGLIRWKTKKEIPVTVDKKAEIAQSLLEDLSPTELYSLFAEALATMQIQDFFGLTTFLTEINLLRPTKKVVNEATVSGQ